MVQPARELRSILVRELLKIVAGKIRRMDVIVHDLPLHSLPHWRSSRSLPR